MITYRKQGLKIHLFKSMFVLKKHNNIVRDVNKMKLPLIILPSNTIKHAFV